MIKGSPIPKQAGQWMGRQYVPAPVNSLVSGGIMIMFMGPTNFTELKEKEQNNFSHMTSCPNLQASNGCGSTHTHAWVYKGISEELRVLR
jgi:hypothetical protein